MIAIYDRRKFVFGFGLPFQKSLNSFLQAIIRELACVKNMLCDF